MNKEEFTNEVLAAEKSMYYVAKSILKNDEDCADAMQNAILSAYRSLDSLRNERYFKTWLTRILINECYTMIRKNKNTVSYEDYMEQEVSGDSNGYSEVYMEIEALEEKYRVPFVLHYVEGFAAKEIAQMLKTTESGIKMRLLRGRNLLRERIGV